MSCPAGDLNNRGSNDESRIAYARDDNSWSPPAPCWQRPTSSPPQPWRSRGRPGANDRLTVAHIGVGGMGGGHLQRMTEFRAEGRVNIAAVCDVDDGRLANAVNVPAKA